MKQRHRIKHGASCAIYAMLIALIGFFTTAIILLVWPYDEVQLEGDAKITNGLYFHGGGVMELEWASYRNSGYDVYYERWADAYDNEGNRLFSFGIPPFIAYHPTEFNRSPISGDLTLPNYLPPGKYKIRFELSYKPNFLRTVTDTTETELFILVK